MAIHKILSKSIIFPDLHSFIQIILINSLVMGFGDSVIIFSKVEVQTNE